MAGKNNGTGQPITFCCAKCRVRYGGVARVPKEHTHRLTGRTRNVGRRSIRMGSVAHEYVCDACGHVGWSRHVDVALTARQRCP